MTDPSDSIAVEQFNALGKGFLPGLIGINFLEMRRGFVEAELSVRAELMAPNGFLHAGSVVSFADTACGYGCTYSLPEGAKGFTTIELKTNFLGTARDGVIVCRANAKHLGRSTQLWDAEVSDRGTGKVMAHFRCTQMVLWSR